LRLQVLGFGLLLRVRQALVRLAVAALLILLSVLFFVAAMLFCHW
jgi:hypothetical protein